ncbi:MAG TPA: site-specific integrase, partial [Thermoplasmata archaeon]
RRINKVLIELREAGRIGSTNPKKMTEADVTEFIAWCKLNLDDTTSAKYIRYLDEVLRAEGNGAVQRIKMLRKGLVPRAVMKPIETVPEDCLARLVGGGYMLEDPWWDAVGKTAIALYLHTGLRSSELRRLRLNDLDLTRMTVTVSSPKGMGRWANGHEISPIMPGIEETLRAYLAVRERHLRDHGVNPGQVEPLFPYLSSDRKADYWHERIWNRLKAHLELASGVRFKWKTLRPSFAQRAKDMGAPIEAVSKCMRHTSTRTTELYYARIRSESAFSLVRQAWKPLPEVQEIA